MQGAVIIRCRNRQSLETRARPRNRKCPPTPTNSPARATRSLWVGSHSSRPGDRAGTGKRGQGGRRCGREEGREGGQSENRPRVEAAAVTSHRLASEWQRMERFFSPLSSAAQTWEGLRVRGPGSVQHSQFTGVFM